MLFLFSTAEGAVLVNSLFHLELLLTVHFIFNLGSLTKHVLLLGFLTCLFAFTIPATNKCYDLTVLSP